MKISEAIRLLSEAGIDSARRDAREIFVRIGGFKLSELIISDAEANSLKVCEAIARRAQREPLQYIIGEVDFYKERYTVSPECLIPRSDTELLVDYAVRNLPEGESFADLCTGSGCVAISTLKNTKNTRAVAVDISEGALALARKNAEQNGVSDRLSFVLKDVKGEVLEGEFFAILSNPPYVTDEEYTRLEPEIYHEPKLAFVGGEDGLDFYKSILSLYINKIKPEGFLAFEIGFEQGDALRALAKENGATAEILKDLSGNDRVAVIKRA